MVRVLCCRFQMGLALLPCCLSKGFLKRFFLGIYLTTFCDSVILKIQNLLGSSFSLNYMKFNLDFKNAAKNWENFFPFSDNSIWIDIIKFSVWKTGYLSSAANVVTNSTKTVHFWSMNIIKVLWCRFQQCLGTFTMFLVEGCSEMGVFRHLSDDVFRVRHFENKKLWGSSFFSKCLKFNVDLKNAAANPEKNFLFLI